MRRGERGREKIERKKWQRGRLKKRKEKLKKRLNSRGIFVFMLLLGF